MVELKKIRPREAAIEQIEWYIQENGLKPHTKLPGEREMCEVWHMNRSTLRAAIQRLIEERILYSEKGSGTFVAPPRLERNLQDAKSTSESMKGTGYFLWTQVLNSGIQKCDNYLSQRLQIEAGSKVYCLRRLRIRNNIPFMIETSYIDYRRCEGIERHNFNDESLYKILKEDFGIIISKGQERVGVTYATEEEASCLKVDLGQFLFNISGSIQDVNEKPVEYFSIVARPDQIRFTSTLRRVKSD